MTSESKYIKSLFENGKVEIRAFINDKRWIGIFDDSQSFKYCAKWAEQKGANVYCTINPTCLPVTGRLRPFRNGTRNNDILRIVRLPFDFDPERPLGEAATPDQVAEALASSEKCVGFLSERGWPEPIRAMSGNGYHLQYAVGLENDFNTKNMLNGIYAGLKQRFTSQTVKFDSTVKSPGQIMRLYGTTNQKSGRRATVTMPDELVQVPFDSIADLAGEISPQIPKKTEEQKKADKRVAGLDVVAMFKKLGLYKRFIVEGKHAVICPWQIRHSDKDHLSKTDTVIWENPSTFYCSHNSCSGKTLAAVAAN